jgi:hypothetical protein
MAHEHAIHIFINTNNYELDTARAVRHNLERFSTLAGSRRESFDPNLLVFRTNSTTGCDGGMSAKRSSVQTSPPSDVR